VLPLVSSSRSRARALATICAAVVLGAGLPAAQAADTGDADGAKEKQGQTGENANNEQDAKQDAKEDAKQDAKAEKDVEEQPEPLDVDNLEDKRAEVDEKVTEADKEHEEASAALQAATDALARAQSDLAQAREHLTYTRDELATAQALDALMQRRLDAAKRRLQRAEKALADGEAEVARQQQDLRAMVVASYERGDPSLMGLSMVFTDQDPAQIAGTMNSSATVANKASAILDGLEATEVILAVQRAEMAAAKEEVALRRQEAADNLAHKQALEMQAEEAEAQVSTMFSLRTRAREAAAKAKKADMAVLAGLIVERDKIANLILTEASRGAGYTGPVNGNGFLSMPVEGYITSPFGYRVHPIYGYRSLHDGIDYGARCGTPVRAGARGKVLTQYYHKAYGNRLVIDHGVKHGVGVATISNHLGMYAVGVGERVKRGQIIGFVGNTGWSTGCHLHYTVLENGEAVDPLRWF
jgi:murein DD-endopeptidase MepM/ murein hydrolase activator NlpD